MSKRAIIGIRGRKHKEQILGINKEQVQGWCKGGARVVQGWCKGGAVVRIIDAVQ